jgi:hypothetical protein
VPGLESVVVSNRAIVEYIKQQDIVVERSPRVGIPFSTLLKSASAASLGTFLGVSALEGYPLLFITVPAGIVVGSALGISKALEAGLNKWVSKIVSGKTTKRATKREMERAY